MAIPIQILVGVVLSSMFILAVNTFPSRTRDPIGLFSSIDGEKRSPINYKNEWHDKEFPQYQPWTTHGEKRSPINYKNEWHEEEHPYNGLPWTTHGDKRDLKREMNLMQGQDCPPNCRHRRPWTTHGEKRSPINYKNEWHEKEFPQRQPWTTYGEKRSPINYKNEWNEEEHPYGLPWTTHGDKRNLKREMNLLQEEGLHR